MASYVGNSPEDILKTRRRNYYYTASAAQTTFTGADDNSNTLNVNESDLEVFMNGVLLDQSDYTANTTHIVLSSAAAANDILEIQTFNDYFVDSNFSRFGGNISGNIIPTANNTYTLGNTTNRFADLYLSGSTLHLGAQTLTSNATHISMSGNHTVSGVITAGQGTHTIGNGTSSSQLVLLAGTTGNSTLDFGDADDGNIGRIQYEHSSDALTLRTNNSERMRIDSSGKVGIGTASPSVPLHLQSSGQDANARFQAADNGYAARLQLYANNVSGASYNAIQSYVNGDSTVQWEISGPKASAEDQMLFHTGGSERMRIDSSGNVGIGVTNPSVALVADGIIASINSVQGTEQLQLQGYGSSSYINMNGSGSLIFRMGSGYSEKMRLTTGGNLGIGTASPDVLLDVGDSDHGSAGKVGIQIQSSQDFSTTYDGTNGNTWPGVQIVNHDDTSNRTAAGITFVHRSSSSGIAAIQSTSDAADRADIRFITRGTGNAIAERMVIDYDGHATVKGTNRDMLILHRQAATGDAGIEFKNNTGTRNQLLMLHGGEMRVDILGSERYSFQNLNGNSIFAVEPSSTGGGGAGGAFLKFKGSNGTAVDIAAIDGSMVDGTAGAEDGILAFFTMQNATLTQRMQINNQGFVGLGTGWGGSIAPTHMLHVKGGDNGTSSILIDNTQTGGGRKWGLRPGSPATNNGYLTIHDETGNQNVMTFNTDGDVGIGSLQPYAPANSKHLTIFNSSMAWNQRAGALFATEAQGTYNAEIYYHRGTTSDADTALKIRVHDTYVAAFRPDGRVWFGTNGDIIDSGLILHVKGDQAANFEATVNTGGGTVVNLNRSSSDGALIRFRHASTTEGTITVSGSTVSYNGGHLSRYAQSTDGERLEGLLKGTVMTNLDQMSVWYNEDGTEEDNEQLNCMAISSVEGDPNVAGVFVSWDEDDDYNDMNIAMTGDMIIRIAEGVVVERGDLLMSAGDGTAKPQGDDIVRSKTIAKVTSTHVTATYDDGSYVVPCVLMAC